MFTPFDLIDGLVPAIGLGLLAIPLGLLDARPRYDETWTQVIIAAIGGGLLLAVYFSLIVCVVWGVLTGIFSGLEIVLKAFL
jgi:hypothetical protein